MSERSFASVVAKSLLPERALVRSQDAEALLVKYGVQRGQIHYKEIASELKYADSWHVPEQDLTQFEPVKDIGSIAVDVKNPLQAFGYDAENRIGLGRRERASYAQLHLRGVRGVHEVQDSLGGAADYIKRNARIRHREYVVGLTFEELGHAATRFGFKAMNVGPCSTQVEAAIGCAHDAFLAINKKPPHSPAIAMVYMPTGEFIERFSVS